MTENYPTEILAQCASFALLDPGTEDLTKPFKALVKSMRDIGVHWKNDTIKDDEVTASSFYSMLVNTFEKLVNEQNPTVAVNITEWEFTFGVQPSGNSLSPVMYSNWAGAEGILYLVLHHMIMVGVKEVTLCDSCGRFIFRTGRPKKFCNNRCRQRNFRSKKTPDEIAQENAERRKIYKTLKLHGDD